MSKSKLPQRCARCRFCHATDTPQHGACRRYPPTPLLRLDGQTGSLHWSHFLRRTAAHFAGKCSSHSYPIVLVETFSCGEFKAAAAGRKGT